MSFNLRAASYQEFKDCLQKHEAATHTKFVYAYGHNVILFTEVNVHPTASYQVHWDHDVPFFHLGSKTFLCHQGKDMNKSRKFRYAMKRDQKASDDDSISRKKRKPKITKKVDCPAKVCVKRIFKMKEYKLNGPPTKSRKEIMSKLLRKKIQEGVQFHGEEFYLYNLPSVEEHKSHEMNRKTAARIEEVDERVEDYIKQLVNQGEKNAAVISKLTRDYVMKELIEEDASLRRFFPDTKSIKKLVRKERTNLSKSDQEITGDQN